MIIFITVSEMEDEFSILFNPNKNFNENFNVKDFLNFSEIQINPENTEKNIKDEKKKLEDEGLKKMSELLFTTTMLRSGYEIEEHQSFADQIYGLMRTTIEYTLRKDEELKQQKQKEYEGQGRTLRSCRRPAGRKKCDRPAGIRGRSDRPERTHVALVHGNVRCGTPENRQPLTKRKSNNPDRPRLRPEPPQTAAPPVL